MTGAKSIREKLKLLTRICPSKALSTSKESFSEELFYIRP